MLTGHSAGIPAPITRASTRYDHHGVAVVIDKKSNLYLDGVTVDFFEDEQRKGFTFDNPNAAGGCCCG